MTPRGKKIDAVRLILKHSVGNSSQYCMTVYICIAIYICIYIYICVHIGCTFINLRVHGRFYGFDSNISFCFRYQWPLCAVVFGEYVRSFTRKTNTFS